MTWEILFFLTSKFEFPSWGLKSDKALLVPNYLPACIHGSQRSISLACLSGQNPVISTIESTFVIQNTGNGGDVADNLGHLGHGFWVGFAALSLRRTRRPTGGLGIGAGSRVILTHEGPGSVSSNPATTTPFSWLPTKVDPEFSRLNTRDV